MGLESGKSRRKARDLQKELRAWPPWRRIQRQYVSRKNWNASAFIFLCLSCRCLPERSSRRMIMWIPAGTLLPSRGTDSAPANLTALEDQQVGGLRC